VPLSRQDGGAVRAWTARPGLREIARDWRTLNPAALVLGELATLILFLHAHHAYPQRPTAPVLRTGWWWWSDQGRYLKSALAWGRLDLAPGQHWYFPGYPMLGAVFARLGMADPFWIPDLLCLMGSLALFAALAGFVLAGRVWGPALGTALFVAMLAVSQQALDMWVIPWTTTPATLCALACLVAALRFQERPSAGLAFVSGLAATAVALFRPTDALVLLVGVPPFLAVALWRARLGWGRFVRITAIACLAAVLPIVLLAATHLAVFGFAPSPYMIESAATGFEWRLIPLRWVTILISPRPIFPDGEGLALGFRWVVPGLVGLLLAMAGALGGMKRRHLLVGVVALLHILLYLSYRDLHSQGLWRYGNVHYFKLVLPLLALYAAALVIALVTRSRLAAARLGLAVALAAILFCWRVEWQADAGAVAAPVVIGPHTLQIPAGLPSPVQAVLVPAQGSFEAIYVGTDSMRAGQGVYGMNADFKAFPVAGGLLFAMLRPMPAIPAVLTVDPGVTLLTDPPAVMGRQRIVYGLPCWGRGFVSCEGAPLLPAPPLPLGTQMQPDAANANLFLSGWADVEKDGRWTERGRSLIRLRPDPKPAGPVQVRFSGNALVPPGVAPAHVTIYAGLRRAARFDMANDPAVYDFTMQPSDLDATDSLLLTFEVANPRRPSVVVPGSSDRRLLGLHLYWITIGTGSASARQGN
jgi:hypothetical protein